MLSKLFRFHGGIKPAYHKEASSTLPIAQLPLADELIIPLHQSIGGTPYPLVKAGEQVLKGQCIGAADGRISSAVHASTSGRVKAVEMRRVPHSSGLSALCVVLEPDGEERWIDCQPWNWRAMTPDETRDYLRDAGVVGLGGAVFPSHLKLHPGKAGKLDTLVINGAECEPFITCDDMQMREQAAAIIEGVLIMQSVLAAGRVLIGIEDNKPEAIAAMQAAVQTLATASGQVEVVPLPTRYPAGGAKQLIRVLTGIEVPHGQRSTDYGVQCFNTGTAYAIRDAIVLGRPLLSRIVTIAGNVERPRNYEVPLGTPIRHLLAHSGVKSDTDRLIMGGPMMGITLPGDDVPVIKATNCIIASSPALFPAPGPEMPCIRCGECAKVCPIELQPFELYWHSRGKQFDRLQDYHLFDCIDCGCCAYVCPSNIPLVDYFRFAKSEIWARERDQIAADEARARHEFRLLREEREKQEKAAKLAAKAAATRAKLEADTPHAAADSDTQTAPQDSAASPASAASTTAQDDTAALKRDLIAAAMARAKQTQATPQNTQNLSPAQQAQIDAIEARRAAAGMVPPHKDPPA